MKEYKIPFIRYSQETEEEFNEKWNNYVEQFKDTSWLKGLKLIPIQIRVNYTEIESKEI